MAVEWVPMDSYGEYEFAKAGTGSQIDGLPSNAIAEVYVVDDPDLRDAARPWKWYVDVAGIDGDSDTGICATEAEAKAAAIRVCRDMRLIEPDPIEMIADDMTLPLF